MGKKLRKSLKTWIWHGIVESRAFVALTGKSPQVLLIFYRKVRVEPAKHPKYRNEMIPSNDGALEFCYSEAKRRGITTGQFTRAISQLVEFGFIDIVEPGTGLFKVKTIYSLSDRWQKWGTPEFVKHERAKDERQYRKVMMNELRERRNRISTGKAEGTALKLIAVGGVTY